MDSGAEEKVMYQDINNYDFGLYLGLQIISYEHIPFPYWSFTPKNVPYTSWSFMGKFPECSVDITGRA